MGGNKKYFFFDIDGTLVDTCSGADCVPESTKEALRLLRKNGHFCSLATGRSHAMAESFLEALDFDNMISDGGYGITINRKLVRLDPIDKELVCELVRECEEKKFPWAISPFNERNRLAPDTSFVDQTGDYYIKTIVEEGLKPENYEKIYKAYVACPPPREFELNALKFLPWCRFSDEYIFVEPCYKGEGIRNMLEIIGGRVEDVVVFGDQMNDMSMFCKDWTSIAMGNAVDELKNHADYVTSDVDNDGIYNACKHFGWI